MEWVNGICFDLCGHICHRDVVHLILAERLMKNVLSKTMYQQVKQGEDTEEPGMMIAEAEDQS